jgi:hypothetical protein
MNARAERDLRQPLNHHGMTIVHLKKNWNLCLIKICLENSYIINQLALINYKFLAHCSDATEQGPYQWLSIRLL